MYSLLPWRWLTALLGAAVLTAVGIDDLGRTIGWAPSDRLIVRYLPVLLVGLFTGFFGPTGHWAPWRLVWRTLPVLNRWFPDLNGVWVGSTNSNWPTIKKMVDTALSTGRVNEQELHDTPEQSDAMAVRITNSLFALRIEACLSSTDGESHSITAKPWRDQHIGRVHLSYVYRQYTPNHSSTDEETHLGAADLALTADDFTAAEGTYWTRRSWRTGRNTAGTLQLSKLRGRQEKGKSLRSYAAEHKAKLEIEDDPA